MTSNSTLLDVPAVDTFRRRHAPLRWLAVAMAVLALAAAALAVVDPREITGQNAWFKPLKFALSIAIYAVTLELLIGGLRRFRRVAGALGTVATIGLAIEIVIIAGAVAFGTTSHYNVSTPLNTTLWSIMAGSIAVVWVVTLLVGVLLFRQRGDDPARTLAIRAGVVLGLAGMAIAFLMTGPTPEQLNDFQGIAGAHAVGAPDDGPGLPFLGWSTVGGDLRVPHFVGLHALQALPLTALGLELLGRRVAPLGDPSVRRGLVLVASLGFAAVLAILTAQALAGEPIVAPSAPVIASTTGVAIAMIAAIGIVIARAVRRSATRVSG